MLLANAYKEAVEANGTEEKGGKLLLKYHKCLFAFVKIMTKRKSLYNKGKFKNNDDFQEIEDHFQVVMRKIFRKIKELEMRARVEQDEKDGISLL